MTCSLQDEEAMRIGRLIRKLDGSKREWVLYRSWCAPELGVVIEVGKPAVVCRVNGHKRPFFTQGSGTEALERSLVKAAGYIDGAGSC